MPLLAGRLVDLPATTASANLCLLSGDLIVRTDDSITVGPFDAACRPAIRLNPSVPAAHAAAAEAALSSALGAKMLRRLTCRLTVIDLCAPSAVSCTCSHIITRYFLDNPILYTF